QGERSEERDPHATASHAGVERGGGIPIVTGGRGRGVHTSRDRAAGIVRARVAAAAVGARPPPAGRARAGVAGRADAAITAGHAVGRRGGAGADAVRAHVTPRAGVAVIARDRVVRVLAAVDPIAGVGGADVAVVAVGRRPHARGGAARARVARGA